MIRPGPQKVRVRLSPEERGALLHLYHVDGAWTDAELRSHLSFGRDHELHEHGLLGTIPTDLGHLTLLLAAGRIAALGRSTGAARYSTQIDRAYLRLALRQLGWTVSPSQQLAREYGLPGMTQVDTPGGPVLVVATLGNGNGTSGTTIRDLVARQRSQALSKDYAVVVLTPSPSRGQRAVAREGDWIRVVPVLPRFGASGRLQISPGWPHEPPSAGPFMSREALDLLGGDLPAISRQTLLLPRRDRVERAVHDLAVDQVMTHTQLHRHYGLCPQDLEGVPYVEDYVLPIHSAVAQEYRMTFFLRRKRQRFWDATKLGHAAFTAETRRVLGVPADPASWSAEPRGALRYEEPDALWHRPFGDVPVEVDTGSYTMSKIGDKLQTFRDRDFLRPCWAVPSPRRARRLDGLIDANVMLVEWFKAGGEARGSGG